MNESQKIEGTKASLKATLADHRELAKNIERFNTDLEQFVAGEEGLREPLLKHIGELIAELVSHFEEEEAEAGFFDEVLAAAPRHAHHIEEFKAEHRAFVEDLYSVQAALHGDDDRSLSDFALFAVELISRLETHEARENELLAEATG